MLVPKKNRKAIYEALFRDGVMVAKKDLTCKHNNLEVPNIHVVKLCQSLLSRGFVKHNYAWCWNYYSLTNEGIEHLREYLHLPADTVPDTLKKATKPQPPPSFGANRGGFDGRRGGRGGGRGGFRGDRDGYRGKKEDGAPDGFKPEFGSRGRGARRGGFQ